MTFEKKPSTAEDEYFALEDARACAGCTTRR